MNYEQQKRNLLKNKPEGIHVLLTGTGYSPLEKEYTDLHGVPTHYSGVIDGQVVKYNIGTTAAKDLLDWGCSVTITARNEKKLNLVADAIAEDEEQRSRIQVVPADLINDPQGAKYLVSQLNIPQGKVLYFVNSIGISAGNLQVQPYQEAQTASISDAQAELSIVPATLNLYQGLFPIFAQQEETRVAFITSLSALRLYDLGVIHCPAKAAVHIQGRTLQKAHYKNNIFISVIAPGAIDTGSYDSPEVEEKVTQIAQSEGSEWSLEGLCLASPIAVAQNIRLAFELAQGHQYGVQVGGQRQTPVTF